MSMSMWNVWPNWLFLLFSFLYVAYICLCEMWPNWLFLLFSFQYVAYICLCEMYDQIDCSFYLAFCMWLIYVYVKCDQIDCSFYLAFSMWLINVYVKCMTKLIVPSIQLSVCGLYWNWLTCLYFYTPNSIVSDSSTLHSRWLLLLKIEISSIVHCCFIINQNELKL
jgi:hypothetical protein